MQSAALAIHTDGAGKRLCARFSCVDKDDLKLSIGNVGIAHDIGTGSDKIASAVHSIIDRFCTSRVGAPKGINAKPILNSRLKEHVTNIFKLFDADGASDEQRAGRLLQKDFKRLRHRLRDKTHASRRINKNHGLRMYI